MERQSGILMPIFSLPSKYGIGGFGLEAYKFIDKLALAGQKVWQILPLVQTGYGNSPYSSVSAESFNPYFISPELLVKEGLLTEEEISFAVDEGKYIDYGQVYSVRYPMLRKAFSRFDRTQNAFVNYINKKESLDYALFMALKYENGQKHFYEWEDKYKYRDKSALIAFAESYPEEISFWQFVQFIAKKQWTALKKYANKKGVKIMGDMPLYVALDSVDVWVNPQLFKLDSKFVPKKIAGVPPDYFCADGQLWGNPVYDYSVHKKDGFKWWALRLKKALTIYDYVRIDHFRGLDRYFEVEFGAENAREGKWIDVPHDELFDAIHKKVDSSRIIAEDLGIIDDGVRELLKEVGYPGMKILSFAFNGEEGNLYLPENITENSVCYTGTHDNDTLRGLIENASEWDRNNIFNGVKNSLEKAELDLELSSDNSLLKAFIELGFHCSANLFIMPWQDVIGVGSDYRINAPGTVSEKNWSIRFEEKDFSDDKILYLKNLTEKYR